MSAFERMGLYFCIGWAIGSLIRSLIDKLSEWTDL